MSVALIAGAQYSRLVLAPSRLSVWRQQRSRSLLSTPQSRDSILCRSLSAPRSVLLFKVSNGFGDLGNCLKTWTRRESTLTKVSTALDHFSLRRHLDSSWQHFLKNILEKNAFVLQGKDLFGTTQFVLHNSFDNEVSFQGNSSLTGCCSKSNMLNWWRCREKSQMVNLHSACARQWLSPRNVAGSRAWPVLSVLPGIWAHLWQLWLWQGVMALLSALLAVHPPLCPPCQQSDQPRRTSVNDKSSTDTGSISGKLQIRFLCSKQFEGQQIYQDFF